MHRVLKNTVLYLVVLLLLSCGGPAQPVVQQPDRLDRSNAVGEMVGGQNQCLQPAHVNEPWLVGLDAASRNTLIGDSEDGIVLVKQGQCGTFKMLPDCVIDNLKYVDHNSSRVNIDSIEIKNRRQLQRNVPLAVAKYSRGMASDEKWSLDYVAAGDKELRGAIKFIDWPNMRSSCKQATHYVYKITKGAFQLSMVNGSEASLEGYVGPASWEQRAERRTAEKSQDGNYKECASKGVTRSDACQGFIKIHVEAIPEYLLNGAQEKKRKRELAEQERKQKIASKKARSAEIKSAYNDAQNTYGNTEDKLYAMEQFVDQYGPTDNPYYSRANRTIKSLKAKVKTEQANKQKATATERKRLAAAAEATRRTEAKRLAEEERKRKEQAKRSKAGEQWLYSRPAKLDFTKTEVTLGQFKKCVSAGNCNTKNRETKSDSKYCNWGYSGRNDHPMNCVDWYGAKDFCQWVGGRLPTEDEWYAEASNGGSWDWPWGDSPDVSCSYAIWGDGSNTDGCGEDRTWPVCSKTRGNSVSGLCDMSGNVYEWTSTKYKSGSDARVVRGGSWNYFNPVYLRASNRNYFNPGNGYDDIGFRCVRSSH